MAAGMRLKLVYFCFTKCPPQCQSPAQPSTRLSAGMIAKSCSAYEGSREPSQPQDAVDEAFVESQVQRFLQPNSEVSALDLCGNKRSTELALQVLKRLLLAVRSRASNQEAANVELEQILLLKKQARVHCHSPLDGVLRLRCAGFVWVFMLCQRGGIASLRL